MIIGFPAEVYLYGGMFVLSVVGIALGTVMAAFIFVPMFYPLGLTSINTVGRLFLLSYFNPLNASVGS